MAEEYRQYKNLKAKRRLLEALLSKRDSTKTSWVDSVGLSDRTRFLRHDDVRWIHAMLVMLMHFTWITQMGSLNEMLRYCSCSSQKNTSVVIDDTNCILWSTYSCQVWWAVTTCLLHISNVQLLNIVLWHYATCLFCPRHNTIVGQLCPKLMYKQHSLFLLLLYWQKKEGVSLNAINEILVFVHVSFFVLHCAMICVKNLRVDQNSMNVFTLENENVASSICSQISVYPPVCL